MYEANDAIEKRLLELVRAGSDEGEKLAIELAKGIEERAQVWRSIFAWEVRMARLKRLVACE